MITIYHNPRCRKSREALNILKESGEEYEIIEYLKSPPTEEKLKELFNKTKLPVEYLIRKNEQVFKENFKGEEHSDEEWITILANNPILIERPIVEKGETAILGRPPENVKQVI